MIEDSAPGIEAAQRAGMTVFAFTGGGHAAGPAYRQGLAALVAGRPVRRHAGIAGDDRGGYRAMIGWRRTRRSMMVCSTTDTTITRPKQSWVKKALMPAETMPALMAPMI